MSLNTSLKKSKTKEPKDKEYVWTGMYYQYYAYFFAEYLDHKYANVCTYRYNDAKYFGGDSLSFDHTKLKKFLLECKKRFLVIPVLLWTGGSLHQNMVIYDSKLNELELFDPFGDFIKDWFISSYQYDAYKKYLSCVKHTFEDILHSKFKFYEPGSIFPKNKNFQNMEIEFCPKHLFTTNTELGFCVVWSLWYAETRIKNPDIPRKELIKNHITSFEQSIKDIKNHESKIKNLPICKTIRDYTLFLIQLDKDKTFREKMLIRMGLNWKQWAKFVAFGGISYSIMFTVLYKFLQSLNFGQ